MKQIKITSKKLFVIISAGFMIAVTNICKAQIESKIPEDSLPTAIHNVLHKKYSDYKISNVSMKTEHQTVTYSLEMEKKTTFLRLIFSVDGRLISKDKSKILTYNGTEKPKSKPLISNDGHNHQH